MISMILLFGSIFLAVTGQLLLKKGMLKVGVFSFQMSDIFPYFLNVLSNLYVLFGLVSYVVSAFVWLVVLSLVPLSFAYPIVSTGYILVALFSWLFLGESIPLIRWVGIFVIYLGVFLISRSS